MDEQAAGEGDGGVYLTSRLEQAFSYALHLHGAQRRKVSGVPYVSHLLSVAALVLEHGGDEDQAIAALLHDAVEDCGGAPRLADIRARFGAGVAEIVDGCTDSYSEDRTNKAPWQERKEQYLARLQHEPERVLLVSLADKLHNARTSLLDLRGQGEVLWSRFNAGREQQLWYYRSLLAVYQQRLPGPLADEFGRVVEELGR